MTNKNGSKWCRPSTRLAIYLRDNLQCVYCLASLEDGAQLTLDHVKPRERGGTNAARNLVTACLACNSRRQDKDLATFQRMYAAAELIPWGVHARVRNATRRALPRELARTLIELRKTPGHTNAVLTSAGVDAACALAAQRASVDLARRIGVPVDAAYGPRNPDDYQRTPQGGTFVV